MKTPIKQKPTKLILSSALAVILLSASVYAFREPLGLVSSQSEIDLQSTPSEDQLDGEETAEQDSDQEPQSVDSSDDNSESSNESVNENEPVITITAASQNDNLLQIRTMIKPLESEGSCELTLSKPNETAITRSAEVQAMPSYSTCKGFNVDVSGLTPGRWDMKVVYISDTTTSTARGSVTIR